MTNSIRLSEKHGLNPTIPVCFFCGKPRNEIALMGKLPNDAEAPKNLIIDYEPCDECKEIMSQGVTCIEVTHEAIDERPPIQEDLYPTGRWCIITNEAGKRIFDTENDIILISENIMNNIIQKAN